QHPGAAFRSAAWLAPWWKTHSQSRRAHILIAKRGGRPTALLPLYREGRRFKLMGEGVVGSDYLGVIARQEDLDEAGRLLAFHLAALDADEVELDGLRSPAEVAAGMDSLLALHRRRWQLEGGSDGITPEVEDFHREAARRLAAVGWAVLFLLHAEGAPRAALYGFRHGDRFAFYQSGHEPEWRPRSVGTVLLGHTIRWAIEQGCSEYDFLRGDEAYKLKWANGARRTVRVRIVG